MKCLNCNTENDNNSKFCIKCGSKLELLNVENERSISINLRQEISKEPKQKKNNKDLFKLIAIIGAAILLTVGIFFLIKNVFFKSNNISKIFDANNPILIEKDNLYGYIDSKGKVIIEPKYKSASTFKGDYAIVKVEDDSSISGSKYQIINKKGEVKLESESAYTIEYIEDYNVWVVDGILYNENLKALTSQTIYIDYEDYGYFSYYDATNNESGIIDYKGKNIFKWEYDSISVDIQQVDDKEYYAEVYSYNNQDVIISLQTGKVLYQTTDVSNYNISAENDGIFKVYDKSTYDVVDYIWVKNEKLAFQLNGGAYSVTLYSENVLRINYGYNYDEKYGKSQRYFYFDLESNKVLEEKPETTNDSEKILVLGSYIEFSCSSKKGLMSDDKIILPCEYDNIDYLGTNLYEYLKTTKKLNLVILEKNDVSELYDIKANKTIYTFDSDNIYTYNSSTFVKSINYKTDKITVYNLLSNKSMEFNDSSTITIYSNYLTVKKEGKVEYYNTKLEKIYEV